MRSLVVRSLESVHRWLIPSPHRFAPTIENGKTALDPARNRNRAGPRRNSRDLDNLGINRARVLHERASVGYHNPADLRRADPLRSIPTLRTQERIPRRDSRFRGQDSVSPRSPTNTRNTRFFVGARGLSSLSYGRALRRASPLFLVLLLCITIFPVHASGLGGFNTSNANQTACNANCLTSPFAGNNADGTAFQNPFTSSAQLFQVGVFVGTILPSRVFILTSAVTPATTHITNNCNAFAPGACPWWVATAGTAFTVADNELLSGIGANAFNTINLGSPVTVSASQWVAVVFQTTGPTSTAGWLVVCEVSCDTNTVLFAEFDFGTTNPVGSFNTATTDLSGGNPIIGASFTTQSGVNLSVSQCYGNCGTPAVTRANTNSTHTTNFNSSITQFYEAQSNLNGIVNNITARVAKSYTNGMSVTLGLYTVDPSCNGLPFSAICPAFLQSSAKFTNPSKGDISLSTAVQISNGQWIGISISAAFNGIDMNDTNTLVNLFQTNGRTPAALFSATGIGTSKMGLYAWVTGNSIIIGPGGPGTNSAGCSPACYLLAFVTALGGGTVGGITAFGILFGLIAGTLLYATRQHDPQGHIRGFAIPMELLVVFAVLLMIAMSAAGALPPYIPFVIIAIAAWLFTSAIWNKRRSSQTGEGAM